MNDFIVLTPTTKEEPKMKRFCYWTVADGKHGKMMETTIASARAAGVKEDFHVWSDQQIEGAINHDCGKFDKTLYLFKFKFLREQVQKLDYDYFIFLDADNYFVRHPGDILSIMGKAPVFVCMENDCGSDKVKRRDWWSCPIKEWPVVLKKYGVKTPKFYNTNAGFWIVKKSVIEQFYSLAMMFWEKCQKEHGYKGFTEEPALAYVGHMLAGDEQENQTLDKTSHIWASDWAHYYSNVIPDGKPWTFEDYMTGEKKTVNPAIVHAMRSKDAMIAMTEERRAAKGVAVVNDVSLGFWMGHQMLGDVFGFCAAAHLLYKKTGQIVKIHYPQEDRKGIVTYFTGVRWVKKEEIPNAINCGGDPSISQWPTMNGVKRFYRFMDPTLKPTLTFDVHVNIEKYKNPKEKLIGLVSHSVTQGDIPEAAVLDMCRQALVSYPGHKIVLLGEKKNNFNFPKEVAIEDRRDSSPDFDSLVEQTRNLSVLLCPQTGPCFVAAGLKVPMWVYRSKQPHWDCVLNYETYKVERWFDRKDVKENLYINWKGGLGDAILHLSSCYYYGKFKKEKVNLYNNSAGSDKKCKELFEIYKVFNPDISRYVNIVSVADIRDSNDNEVFEPKWNPVPSDNCVKEKCNPLDKNFITSFKRFMNFNTDFFCKYLRYIPVNKYDGKKYVTLHVIGNSGGNYLTDYNITKQRITNLINMITTNGYDVRIIQPVDDFCNELALKFQNVSFVKLNSSLQEMFEVISHATVHIGVDSGPAHVALSCGTPYYPFIHNREVDITFKENDFVIGKEEHDLILYLKYGKINPVR